MLLCALWARPATYCAQIKSVFVFVLVCAIDGSRTVVSQRCAQAAAVIHLVNLGDFFSRSSSSFRVQVCVCVCVS